MPHIPETKDVDDWHRYFAILNNNRAWELAVADRTAEDDRELLNYAHASAYHWSKIGTELNVARAQMLLAETHALLGLPTSFDLASAVLSFFTEQSDTPDWEIAFAHTIYSHAAAVVGDSAEHQRSYREAQEAIERITDPEDKAIVMQTFTLVPSP